MSDRYFGRVVETIDQYKVVMNKGEVDDVTAGQKFVVVGLGDIVVDPDTNEELERLEIVRGYVTVTHVQSKIATLESYKYQQYEDTREIKKGQYPPAGTIGAWINYRDTATESIIPGKKRLKALEDVEIGDYMIRI